MRVRQLILFYGGLLGALLGLWLLATSVVQTLGSLPSSTRAAVIGLIGVVLVSIITFFTTRYLDRRRARDEAIREKRTDFYDKTIRGMLRMFNIDKTAPPSTPDDMAKFFAEMTPELVLYASHGVVRAWNNFRRAGGQQPPNQAALIVAFESLLREMRRDLGHAVSSRPDDLELIAMFVTDIDNLRTVKAQRKRRQK